MAQLGAVTTIWRPHILDLLFDRPCSRADKERNRGNMKSLLENSTYMTQLNE